jgi:hypothetical protein
MTPNNQLEADKEIAPVEGGLATSTPAVVAAVEEEPGGAMTFFEHLTELD